MSELVSEMGGGERLKVADNYFYYTVAHSQQQMEYSTVMYCTCTCTNSCTHMYVDVYTRKRHVWYMNCMYSTSMVEHIPTCVVCNAIQYTSVRCLGNASAISEIRNITPPYCLDFPTMYTCTYVFIYMHSCTTTFTQVFPYVHDMQTVQRVPWQQQCHGNMLTYYQS